MKSVLTVDVSAEFCEFIRGKLLSSKIAFETVDDKLDAVQRMSKFLPELTIFEIGENDKFDKFLELIRELRTHATIAKSPIFVIGPFYEKEKIAELSKLGVSKYFVKPVKFDVFFDAIGKLLGTVIPIDTTPSIININRNENFIFIEVAQGFNREKISILKYRLAEIIDKNIIKEPKIIVMLSALEPTFVDGLNIEFLIDNIIEHQKVFRKNVKLLSKSDFIKELIIGHPEYEGIEVTDHMSQDITMQIANATAEEATESSIGMNFELDIKKNQTFEQGEENKLLSKRVAIIDDDTVILDLLANAFRSKGITVENFNNGLVFLDMYLEKKYDLVILDILMPGITGFDILKKLKTTSRLPPIFVYSHAMNRELIIQVLSMGAKQFFVKPQKSEVIVQKAIEIFNGTK